MKTGKNARQELILRLIREKDISTQEDLTRIVREAGFEATQATCSRDIKELRLVKVPSSNGAYKYASENVSEDESQSHSYLFSTAVTNIDYAHALVVIKTKVGMAQAVCAALDSTNRAGVIGTIAGDDTIFVATRSDSASSGLVSDLKKLMSDKSRNEKK